MRLSSTIAITKPNIVIVDDESDLVTLFSEALKSNGFDVYAFTDSTTALKNIKNNPHRYSLLITDYNMPKLNGCELGIKTKELNDNMKVILISASDNIEGNRLNFELLKKPIPIPALLKKVNNTIVK